MLARSFSALTRKYGKYGLKFNKSKTHLRHQYLSRNSECNPHRPKNILQRNMCMETMTVFDRKLKTSQRDDSVFIRQSTGEDYDYLRSYSANSLADRLDDIMVDQYDVALELGAGNGLLAKILPKARAKINTLIQTDISEKLLNSVPLEENKDGMKVIRQYADEEALPFKEKSIDLVISNLSLHWVNDLPGTFAQIQRILKPNGLFIASMFGENTLIELRNSFMLAEQEREGGISAHVSPSTRVSDVGNLLSGAKFALPTVDMETITVNYADPFVLMRDLKGMGENNAVLNRKETSSSSTLFATASIYKELYSNPDGSVPATFQIIYMIGWAPHPSQQKPLQRGSAERSLKELDNSQFK